MKDVCECGNLKNKRARTCRGCWAPHNKSTLPSIDELISSRELGLTLKELEKKFGVCRKTLSNILRDNGVDMTNRGSWKGGRRTDKEGYVQIWIDGRYVSEHRFVMSKILGRELLPKEEVHHKNGIKDDNDPSNLELWSKSQPNGGRIEDKIAWAIEFLTQYGYEVK